ncbi:MAG: hypothetical protein ALAOOOJD_02622 [bacterium]|nr:hypothetical protein [bacterium]
MPRASSTRQIAIAGTLPSLFQLARQFAHRNAKNFCRQPSFCWPIHTLRRPACTISAGFIWNARRESHFLFMARRNVFAEGVNPIPVLLRFATGDVFFPPTAVDFKIFARVPGRITPITNGNNNRNILSRNERRVIAALPRFKRARRSTAVA